MLDANISILPLSSQFLVALVPTTLEGPNKIVWTTFQYGMNLYKIEIGDGIICTYKKSALTGKGQQE